MDKLFEEFLREKRYLSGVARKTIVWYETSYKAYKRVLGSSGQFRPDESVNTPTKHALTHFVIGLREQGLQPTGINYYVRGMNVFLTWLFENEHIKERLRIKKVKEEQKVLQTFSDKQLEAIIDYKPRNRPGRRLHTLLLLVIDTGIRIDEALTLKRENVDLDALLIKVMGKGKKERIVPISLECRKALFRNLRTHNFDLLFCTRTGTQFSYTNALRNFKALGIRLGITGVRVSFHTLRHTFAVNYIRQGGNVLYLQRALGHTDLTMTRRYVNLQTEDLKLMHQRTSILSRLR